MQLVTLDPHGPNEMRCNGTLRNVPEFLQVFGCTVVGVYCVIHLIVSICCFGYQAFEIQEGDAMYLPPEQRVDIW